MVRLSPEFLNADPAPLEIREERPLQRLDQGSGQFRRFRVGVPFTHRFD